MGLCNQRLISSGWIPVIFCWCKLGDPRPLSSPKAVGEVWRRRWVDIANTGHLISVCTVGQLQRGTDQAHTTTPKQVTHASRLGVRSRSGGRGFFLADGDTAAPEGLFSRRQGLEPGLTKAMVPCSWLAILWDTCGRGENVPVSRSAAHPGKLAAKGSPAKQRCSSSPASTRQAAPKCSV